MDLRRLLFSKDDAIVAFNLFCCVCGIGTLGMPANYARAGPVYGLLAMLFMGFANVYASVVCSKVMLVAPKSVKTFGDLGDWCMGRVGRHAVVVSQMLICLLAPTAFLVLGGSLLDTLFPNAFSQTFWIVFMALMVLPVCLTPTLKEGAGAAFAGCLGTVVADVVGVGMLLYGMEGHPSVPKPDVSLEQVVTTFGNLALAYGAAVVIPSLQRHHKHPERMPFVVGTTMIVITVLFIALAWSGYSAVGCQISGNLLFNVFPNADGISSLGMKANFGAAVIAYLFMQLHITIAFAVLLYPACYLAERVVLGMHKTQVFTDVEEEDASSHSSSSSVHHENGLLPYRASGTPNDAAKLSLHEKPLGDACGEEEDEAAEYKGAMTVVKYVLLRLAIVAVLVVVAVVLQDKFIDLSDFVGASANTFCCILLPIAFYMKKLGHKMPLYEKAAAVVVLIVCSVLGVYVTYKSGKKLFTDQTPGPNDPVFPFCEAEHQMTLYYLKP